MDSRKNILSRLNWLCGNLEGLSWGADDRISEGLGAAALVVGEIIEEVEKMEYADGEQDD